MLPRNVQVTTQEYEEYKNSLIQKFDRKLEKSLKQLQVVEEEQPSGTFSSKSKFAKKSLSEPTVKNKKNQTKKAKRSASDTDYDKIEESDHQRILARTKPDPSVVPAKKTRKKKSDSSSNANTTPVTVSQWAKFKSVEYPKYKNHMKGSVMSYADFTKRASKIWNALSANEKDKLSVSGWGGNWTQVSNDL